MSFHQAIRSILQEAGVPLTSVEIRERIELGFSHLYGTQSHIDNYPTVEHGVIAQIATTVRNARDLYRDNSVRPMLISLDSFENEQDIPIAEDYAVDKQDDVVALAELEENREHFLAASPRSVDHFELKWTRCPTYDDAKNFSNIIYLHEWHGEPFYWGIARTYFGGSRRTLGDRMACGRYNSGYRHWIEGSLRHGAKLYVATITKGDQTRLQEIENYLICTYGHQANRRETAVLQNLAITHTVDVPLTVTAKYFFDAA